MTSSNLNIVYDDGDNHYKDKVRKFISVLREKTVSWGFNCIDERPGLNWFDQLRENLDSTSVTIVVILPNHDDRQDKAKYAAQSALWKTIQNKEKYLIPVCLLGGESKDFELLTPLDFRTEEDWNNECLWGKLKTVLEERCHPVSKKRMFTSLCSCAPEVSCLDLPNQDKLSPSAEGATVLSTDSDSIPCFMTDRFFLETSMKIVNVWWKLGIRLRLESNAIFVIEKNRPQNVAAMAFEMLKRWKESSHTDSEQEQIVILCLALRAEKKNDLANEVHNSYKGLKKADKKQDLANEVHNRYKDFSKSSTQIEIKSSEPDKSIDNDIFLLELAARLPDWYGFFVLLNVCSDELQILKQDYPQDTQRGAFQALVLWRSECGGLSNEAKKDKLIGVLREKRREDLVDWIKGIQPMSSEDWKMCFDANTKGSAQKLIDSDIKLDQTTLDFACTKLDRRSEEIKAVCKRICDDFNRQTGVKHTWPAYTDTKGDASFDGNITFVVLTDDNKFDDEGYTCHVRNVNEIDEKCKFENKEIKQREQANLRLIRELNDVQECIDMNSKDFKTKHKYCWRITPSPFKSTGFKTDTHLIKQIKCIALYVPVKGFIPLDEEPFPATIGEFPVDVREGNIVIVF